MATRLAIRKTELNNCHNYGQKWSNSHKSACLAKNGKNYGNDNHIAKMCRESKGQQQNGVWQLNVN